MRARPGHMEEEDDPDTHNTQAVISAMNALAKSPSQKREMMIQQQLAEQQQQQEPDQPRGGSAEQRGGSSQQQQQHRAGGSPGSRAYGVRMTPAAKAAQIAAAAERAFVGTNPRELWDEEGAVFVELGLLASGRLFGGSNGPPGKRGGGLQPAASGGQLATSLSVAPSVQPQGDLRSKPSLAHPGPGLGGGAGGGKVAGLGVQGSGEGVDVGARDAPQASGTSAAASTWWATAGLKKRAVSAVTDTRAELFVFRREEVEVSRARVGQGSEQ